MIIKQKTIPVEKYSSTVEVVQSGKFQIVQNKDTLFEFCRNKRPNPCKTDFVRYIFEFYLNNHV
jgi:hypothetical protein